MPRLTFDHVIPIGDEEHVCRVTGSFVRGYPATWEEPGADDEFDVEKVEVPIAIRQFGQPTGKFRYLDIVDVLTAEQISDIAEQGVMEAREGAVAAAEQRAEMRREDSFLAEMVEICRPVRS